MSGAELTTSLYTLRCVSNSRFPSVVVADEVATALHEGRGVTALETTIIVHGLPAPINFDVARACEDAVRASGSTPATIGVLDGRVVVGLSAKELEALASPERRAAKFSARDLGVALATGTDGATTVAGTIAVAHRVGISVMATGGLGGVHRDANESHRRVRGPHDARAHARARGRLGREVDPRHRRDAGAPRHPRCPVVGYRDATVPGLLLAR